MGTRMGEQMMRGLATLRWEPTAKWVRATIDGRTVVDSRAARLVWEPRRVVPTYAVPVGDIAADLEDAAYGEAPTGPPVLSPMIPFRRHSAPGTAKSIRAGETTREAAAFLPDDPDLAGYAVLEFRAFDGWTEEDQEVISHPHDPFSRIDCLRSDRHVVVSVDGVVLADSRRPVLLLETGLPPRWYLPREDVRLDLLEPSRTHTQCAYKGTASYWSARVGERLVEDLVWTYPDPLVDALPVRDLLCFYSEHSDIAVDGEGGERPVTEWS